MRSADVITQSCQLTTLTLGLSRQFAFAQFATLTDAQLFYDRTPPSIQFKNIYGDIKEGEDSSPHVTIAYSREKPDERPLPGQGDDDWICEVV